MEELYANTQHGDPGLGDADNQEGIRRQAELELQLLQQQSHVELTLRDKRQAEQDLD